MKALAFPLVLVVLAVAGACDPPEPGPTRARALAPPASATAAVRGRLVSGEKVERVVQWPAASTRDEAARGRLSQAALRAVDASPVPVLAPASAAWERPFITSPRGPRGPGFGFALSASGRGRTLALQGSRLATLVPGVGRHEGTETLRGVPGFVTENEGVKSARWIEHGVAYSADLECASARDPGCDAAALRAEVEALVYVGGAGHGGGQ